MVFMRVLPSKPPQKLQVDMIRAVYTFLIQVNISYITNLELTRLSSAPWYYTSIIHLCLLAIVLSQICKGTWRDPINSAQTPMTIVIFWKVYPCSQGTSADEISILKSLLMNGTPINASPVIYDGFFKIAELSLDVRHLPLDSYW